MPKGRRTDSQKRARWGELLREFEAAGLSVREFCLQRGLPEHRFYWWRRLLNDARPTEPACGGALFLPVRVKAAAPPLAPSGGDEGRIELLLGGGVTVRLTGEVPPGRLAAVLGVLDERGGQSC